MFKLFRLWFFGAGLEGALYCVPFDEEVDVKGVEGLIFDIILAPPLAREVC